MDSEDSGGLEAGEQGEGEEEEEKKKSVLPVGRRERG